MKGQHENSVSPALATVPVAIVGIGCMFPKAEDLARYWANIRACVDAITDIPSTHWRPEDYYDADPKAPDRTYARRGGFLTPVDFPALEFGIAPNNLDATDTTQLLGLLVARAALDDAGYGSAGTRPLDRDRVSVILGVTGTLELVIPLGARLGHPIWRRALKEAGVDPATSETVVKSISDSYVGWQENSFPGLLGNVAAGRIANRLDLGGTNCVIDAACASSIGALNLALLELSAGRCDLALTGGLDTFNDIFMYMCFSKTPALSPTGDARPFDAQCDGTILGEGLGVLALKRLDDARRDGDRIYAVVRSVGSSSDGKGNAVYAPSATGQAKALRSAYALATIGPETIELVEAHGTGTKVGDSTELAALADVYRAARPEGTWCALGSVKSQIGHTKAAAGAAGLIKAALALHHKVIPPTAKVTEPLEGAAPGASPFYVNTEARPWLPRPDHPRRAAVSAFGFGGSNFHCVLEEAGPAKPGIDWDGDTQIVAFAAENVEGLRGALDAWPPHSDWPATRVEAARSRARFRAEAAHRLVFVLERGTDLAGRWENARALLTRGPGVADGMTYAVGPRSGGLAFLFPGQGAQYVGMLRDLACQFPAVLDALAAAEGHEGASPRLSDFVFPQPAFSESGRADQERALRATATAQPAIGAISLGVLGVLDHFGVRAEWAAGHSFGELTALHAAGRISAEALHALARLRGQLMAEHAGAGAAGGMLAVLAPLAEVEAVVRAAGLDLTIANKNAPRQAVLSGPVEEIARAERLFAAANVVTKPLAVSAAFHSRLVADASGPLLTALRDVPFEPGRIPVLANSTARAYPDDADASRTLLAEQLARPVEFVGLIEGLYQSDARTFLEVGPDAKLTGLVGAILDGRPHQALAVDASRGQRGNVPDLARVLARLAALGHPVVLTRWDEGVDTREAPARKPGLTVKLSGANVSPPLRPAPVAASPPKSNPKPTPAARPESHGATPFPQPRRNGTSHELAMSPHQNGSASTPRFVDPRPQPPFPPPRSGDPGVLGQALRDAQQNLVALQKLGAQTARLHRQFLEGQDQTQRTFQLLLEQQQRLTAVALGKAPAPAPAAESLPSSRFEPIVVPAPSTPRFVEPPPAPKADAPNHAQAVLRDVVSEKTGYPAEMLEPDMQLDADLGIDSIKRVEILSALQERLPDAPVIQAEHLGTLRTLRQIAEFLSSTSGNGPSRSRNRVQDVLVAVVAEKTGYPAEMLEPDMQLDADLGIDSIKRVEILSALQERLPDAPVIQAEHLGTLRTLRQIAEFLGPGSEIAPAPRNPPEQARDGGLRVAAATLTHPTNSTESVSAPVPRSTPALSAGRVQDVLIAVVSEKTGYPAEMLEPSMQLDADLGIDSIKRVEILSVLQERLPEAPIIKPEHLGTLRTLGAIAQFLAGDGDEPIVAAPVAAPVVLRLPVQCVALAEPSRRATVALRPDAEFWITADGTGLAEALANQLRARGSRTRLIARDEVAKLAGPERLDGLVLLADDLADESSLLDAFRLLRTASAGLRASGKAGAATFATVSRLDGAFGLRGSGPDFGPMAGGLAGLSKTAGHEWPEVHCKAIDIDPRWDLDKAASAIIEELLARGPVEVGLSARGRTTLQLQAEPLATTARSAPWAEGDVVVVTGGARGVTAEAAIALAEAFRPTIVVWGRTPAPADEPDWLAPLDDEAAIKRALATRANGHATPRAVGEQFRRVAANRELVRNLERISAAGARVIYQAIDVRDAQAVAARIAAIRAEYGPIRGLVHGAGVLADRALADQTDEQFATVVATKVTGLRVLLGAIGPDELKALALFSSSTARFGRPGQVAYATANEVLNKSAQRESRARPGCRVVAFNWGPWDGGMVTPGLKPLFESEGIALIPLHDGARCLVDELSTIRPGPVEIVILGAGSQLPTPPEAEAEAASTATLATVFERPVTTAALPILGAHVIDGRPVLPMALVLEWFAQGAQQRNPGLMFAGVNDLRLLKGVVLRDDQPETVRVLAGKAVRRDGRFVVPVELRGTLADGREVPHARAEVVLADRLDDGRPELDASDLPASALDVAEAYQRVLFHGPALRGIERIDACGELGIAGWSATAPPPDEWVEKPLRQTWLSDPLALDVAFQLLIVWSAERSGAGSLPTFIGRYRQFRRAFPPAGVRVLAKISQAHDHRARADIEFLDADGALVARIDDYECVIDAALNQAFRRNRLVHSAR